LCIFVNSQELHIDTRVRQPWGNLRKRITIQPSPVKALEERTTKENFKAQKTCSKSRAAKPTKASIKQRQSRPHCRG
ncbi:hypothetical protein BSL78_04358, partial [Apostichopus japonicus]